MRQLAVRSTEYNNTTTWRSNLGPRVAERFSNDDFLTEKSERYRRQVWNRPFQIRTTEEIKINRSVQLFQNRFF